MCGTFRRRLALHCLIDGGSSATTLLRSPSCFTLLASLRLGHRYRRSLGAGEGVFYEKIGVMEAFGCFWM